MNKLLYFPKIELPNNDWLKRTLLYWDEVASIVPIKYIDNPERFGRQMRELVSNGLVRQLIPEQFVYSFNRFEENFIEYLFEDPIMNKITELCRLSSGEDTLLLETEYIHMGKMANLGDQLVEIGLAFKENNWYKVERNTANAFMTYLSFLIGSKSGYIPATDNYSGFTHVLEARKFNDSQSLKKCTKDILRTEILENILPVPAGKIDVVQFLHFKEKKHEELARYRKKIEDFLLQIELTNEDDKYNRVQDFIRESEEEIDSIKDKLRFFGCVNLNFVTFLSITSAAIPITDAIITRDLATAIKSLPGVLGAAISSMGYDERKKVSEKPLAYAAILERTRFNKR